MIEKIGKFFFWLQYIVFGAGLLLIFAFGDFLESRKLDEAVIIITYFFGLPSVLSTIGILLVKDEKPSNESNESET